MSKPASTTVLDGLYDRLLDENLSAELASLIATDQASIEALPAEQRSARLAEAFVKILVEILDGVEPEEAGTPREKAQFAVIAGLLGLLRKEYRAADLPSWPAPLSALRSIHRRTAPFVAPATGVLRPWLFTAGRADPSLLADLRAELDSADEVDILVSFIKWSGVRKLMDRFEAGAVTGADGVPRRRARILTTTYMGATEARAVLALAKLPGVTVKVSYDTRRTRLHAKAWLFHRATGFGTAFVGSANISNAALIGGLEWTVKFTQAAQVDLYVAAQAQFESLWNDPEFELFDPGSEADLRRLSAALSEEANGRVAGEMVFFDLTPKAYQVEMLNRLARERELGRTRNLLVAATGTGKTVVAALDYRALCHAQGGQPRLLFVAHRVEILRQAMATYRQALRSPAFGEVLAEGREPVSFDHLFASIQSVGSAGLLERFGPDYWHTVVIDECHHLPALSFDAFARVVRPKLLLGLTATPLRADGKPIADYFDPRPDNRPAVELRLWHALDQQLLAPFEYYGTADETDLSDVRWNGGATEIADLDRVISGDHIRARLVIQSVQKYCSDVKTMRALAFCVSVRHAEFMAEQFKAVGLAAVAVTGGTDRDVRQGIPSRLARGDIQIVCTCDLYNEGVDLPDVNILLLLRPTQSPVLFEQQLGRGLRLVPEKESCLVLDFVGRYREEFRFDQLLQVMTGLPKRRVIQDLEHGFPTLPPACHIAFDRVAGERVLASLKYIARQTWPRLARELQGYAAMKGPENISLAHFLNDQALELSDVYRASAAGGWTALRRSAGLLPGESSDEETYLGRRFSDLLHSNDALALNLWRLLSERGAVSWDELDEIDRRRVQMLAYQLFPGIADKMSGKDFLDRLEAHRYLREELGELSELLAGRTELPVRRIPGLPEEWPLLLYGRYEIREILTAVGWLSESKRTPHQSGKISIEEKKIEVLFVTLNKAEGYHDRISYHDYAISPEIFHWQTQNSAGPDTTAGRRYSESPENGWRFFLFVRENKDAAYCALGPATKVQIEGDRPMSLQWKLAVALPMKLFRSFSVLRA
jgi:superfamily II DNA or RNA helicase/HKD family nuclease